MNTAYITCKELMEIAPIGKSTAYNIINQVNAELKAMGKITIRGKAPREYTLDKMALKNPADLGTQQD